MSATTTWGLHSSPKRALLIHGLTSSSHTWIEVAPELVKHGYHVTAPDLLGHGLSPPSQASYQIADFVSAILALLPSPQIQIDLLIAHSLGGPISLALYEHLNPKPKRLILVDPALERSPTQMEGFWAVNLLELQQKPSAADFKARNPAWSQNSAAVKSLAVALARVEAVEAITKKINPWSFTSLFPPPSPSTEIILIPADPAHGAVLTAPETAAIAKERPDIKIIIAHGAGHGIQREQPELIIRAALEEFEPR